MRHLLAIIFRVLFRLNFLKSSYYGFYKRIFKPLNLFKGVRKKILYRGQFRLNLDIEDWIQQNLYFCNEYENREIRFVEHYLKNGDVFIDVGANIGLFSLIASRKAGDNGSVYAFEPVRKTYDLLRHHLELNHIKNVKPEQLAVSDRQGEIKILINEQEKNSGMASAHAHNFTSAETVPSVSLDQYFADKNPGSVRLVKIDIEGGEYHALLGMEKLLRKDRPLLLIEINPDVHYGQNNLENFLSGLGYKKYFISDDNSLAEKRSASDRSFNYIFS